MKAIACPNCSAPIALQQGVAVQKCSFCDTEVKPDFESAPDFAGLEDKQYEKLFRRALDSEQRDFIQKAELQFRTLLELLEGENSEREIAIQIKCYELSLRLFLEQYYGDNGETLLSFQHEVEYAPAVEPSFSYMRIDGPMIELIDNIEDRCENLPEDLRLKLVIGAFNEFNILLRVYIADHSVKYILNNCSNCFDAVYADDGTEYMKRFPLQIPIYTSMQILAEMYSMLIRYTEILDLGDARDDALLEIKAGYEKFLLIDFVAPHHRDVYRITDITNDRTIDEFFSYKSKLDEKLAPLLAERALIQKQKAEAERAEQERIAAEKERKHQEWLASPEYKAMRQKQIKTAAICAGVVALLAAAFAISGGSEKNTPEDQQSRIHFSIVT